MSQSEPASTACPGPGCPGLPPSAPAAGGEARDEAVPGLRTGEAGLEVTARDRLVGELARAKEAAEEASRAKSIFLATMSHEIRTPLSGIIGMSSLLQGSDLTPSQRECVDTIVQCGESLLEIISGILDFSKIEAGRIELEEAPFSLADVVYGSLDVVSPAAAAKGLALTCEFDPAVPAFLQGDRTRLRQILINLLANAIKFTGEGEISLQAGARVRQDGRWELSVAVRDTGLGIDPATAARLFEPFVQADASVTRRFGGTGLGLAICRRLVELMEGTIAVDSQPGLGSTFRFQVLLRPDPRPDLIHGAPDHPELLGRRVLVVDGNPRERHHLGRLLEAWGMQPILSERPTDALNQVAAQPPPEVVLVAQQLPSLTGLELAAQLWEDGHRLPVILLTNQMQPELHKKRPAVETVLLRPTHPQVLREALRRAFRLTAVPGPQAAAEPPAPPVLARRLPLRILLAEDNPVNQKVILYLLAKLGYVADSVENGAEALEAAARQHYDLIFLDIEMPVMDGLRAAAALRQRYAGRRLAPLLVALTAHAVAGDRERFLAAGFHEYLTKPIRLEDFERLILREFEDDAEPQEWFAPSA